ncbi:MAG: L,D-transpeptidase [Ahrensia sp.]|nr:L,D-transpeptidase [Ahrensia sp.]
MFRVFKFAALCCVFAMVAHYAQAGQRYATPPPITLSPDLSSAWTLQIKPQRRAAPRQKRAHRQLRTKRHTQRQRARIKRQAAPRVASLPRRQRAQTRPKHRIDPALLPATVRWHGSEKPGTVIVNTIERRLYLITAPGQARRYAVGVGKPGFEWAGTHRVSRKAEWPSWRPPASMIARERKKGRILPTYMPGGVDNPMGARALYLGSSLYRIHGTNQAWSIGQAVSSGCIRMRNEDVMDLYDRVPVGARVKVI